MSKIYSSRLEMLSLSILNLDMVSDCLSHLVNYYCIQGFVTFDEEDDAQKALDDLGKDTRLCGKRVDIQPARGGCSLCLMN